MATEPALVELPDDGRAVRRRVERRLAALAAGGAVLVIALGLITTWGHLEQGQRQKDLSAVAKAQQLNVRTAAAHEDLQAAVLSALAAKRSGADAAEIRSGARAALEDLKAVESEIDGVGLPAATAADARQLATEDVNLSTRLLAIVDQALAGKDVTSQLAAAGAEDEQLDADRDRYADKLQGSAESAARANDRAQAIGIWVVWGSVPPGLLLLGLTFVGIRGSVLRMTRRLQDLLTENENDAARGEFGRQVVEAFDMADDEDAAREVVSRAMVEVSPDLPMELLLADSSKAHLARAAGHPTSGTPCCPVGTPFECVAVRRGTAVTFDDSEALHACPKLRDRESGPVSAACVPITFMGRAIGVLHAAGPQGSAPDPETVERLARLAAHTGSRIGTLRATRQTQLQAATDSLTGLVNRRTLDHEVRELLAGGRGFALAFGDLDHFKALNDRYGHDAGDRALRLFAKVLREATRSDDVVARYGGEEFVVVLPGRSASEAVEAMQRIRTRLSEAVATSDAPTFTVSFGVTDSSMGTTVTDLVRSADGALLAAKSSGRDRVVVAGTSVIPEQTAAVD